MARSTIYIARNVGLKAIAILQVWVETDDLDEGETLADRLMMLTVGIADKDKDGEIDDAEHMIIDHARETMWDYLSGKGVSDEDCSLLLNDWDPEAADRVRDFLASNLPDDEDAALADRYNFVFGDEAEEPMMDVCGEKWQQRSEVEKGRFAQVGPEIKAQNPKGSDLVKLLLLCAPSEMLKEHELSEENAEEYACFLDELEKEPCESEERHHFIWMVALSLYYANRTPASFLKSREIIRPLYIAPEVLHHYGEIAQTEESVSVHGLLEEIERNRFLAIRREGGNSTARIKKANANVDKRRILDLASEYLYGAEQKEPRSICRLITKRIGFKKDKVLRALHEHPSGHWLKKVAQA